MKNEDKIMNELVDSFERGEITIQPVKDYLADMNNVYISSKTVNRAADLIYKVEKEANKKKIDIQNSRKLEPTTWQAPTVRGSPETCWTVSLR